MTPSIQPELWVERASAAVAFYQAAFGATVMHQVGDGDDIVAQLSVDGAEFWVAEADPSMRRLDPRAIDGTTSRTLLVIATPTTSSGGQSTLALLRSHPSATSTAGASAASPIHSATNGRSDTHSAPGHQPKRPSNPQPHLRRARSETKAGLRRSHPARLVPRQ